MKRTLFFLVLVVLLATSLPAVADPSRGPDARIQDNSRQGPGNAGVAFGGPRGVAVLNRVLDLLHVAVFFDTDSADPIWESKVFDTSQFNRIGLKASGSVDRGGVACGVHWRFSPDDEFIGSQPLTMIDATVGGERPDGIPGLHVGTPSSYSEVYGLQAKVVCAPIVIVVGDDPSIGETGASGGLADVKVLLRRE